MNSIDSCFCTYLFQPYPLISTATVGQGPYHYLVQIMGLEINFRLTSTVRVEILFGHIFFYMLLFQYTTMIFDL